MFYLICRPDTDKNIFSEMTVFDYDIFKNDVFSAMREREAIQYKPYQQKELYRKVLSNKQDTPIYKCIRNLA